MESSMPSAQPSVQHREILLNPQGSPLRINLQAVELEGRPKLVRMLKSSGALVVSNAKEAAIILVDSATESGKRLIRTWGRDTSKVVLEHTWTRSSIDAGRPLLKADNWGGAMTIDDGKPVTIDGVVVDEDELEEVEALVTKSPLPTPRVTPVDAASQRLRIVNENSVVPQPNGSVTLNGIESPSGSSIVQPVAVAATISEEPLGDTHSDTVASSNPPPSAKQPLPHQPTLFMQPPQSQNTFMHAPFAAQPIYPSSQPQIISTQPFQHPGLSSTHSHVTHPSSASHITLPSIHPSVIQMTPSTISVNGVDLQGQSLATLMTIMEVVRQSGWMGQNQLSAPQPPVTSGPSSTFNTQAIGGSGSFGTNASLSRSLDQTTSDPAASSRKHKSSVTVSEGRRVTTKSRLELPRPPDGLLTSSISRKRPSITKSANTSRKRLRKGKEKGPPTDSSEQSGVDGLIGTSDCSHSTRSSFAWPRKIVAAKKYGEIFLSESLQPLRFFVQVDLHGRHAVVTNIKKNKGRIVNNIADADYVILFARSDTFQGLLNEAIALGKTPILAAFVADCVEESALLDETDYILESAARVKALKRDRQDSSVAKAQTPKKSRRRAKVEEFASPSPIPTGKGLGTPPKPPTEKKKKTKKTPKSAPSRSEEGRRSGSRSPTPPPTTARRLMCSGKYLFTEEEDEYFLLLAKYHLTRDPTVSNNVLMSKLHKKLPHHSLGSWSVHIDKKLKGALEDVRKRANIANRKCKGEAALPPRFTNGSSPSENGRPSSNAEKDCDTPPNLSYPSQEELECQDFDVITRFFASGKGDDDDDERVWQELEKHQTCRSADSWPDYYAAHQDRVYARIEELVNEHAGD